ncbi:hypothetical protein C8R44DRAFT_891961 [Mycena epipterygia]|nr:hypothetical protein C8R44DRAFT_891961 [Mycena epipterygia]
MISAAALCAVRPLHAAHPATSYTHYVSTSAALRYSVRRRFAEIVAAPSALLSAFLQLWACTEFPSYSVTFFHTISSFPISSLYAALFGNPDLCDFLSTAWYGIGVLLLVLGMQGFCPVPAPATIQRRKDPRLIYDPAPPLSVGASTPPLFVPAPRPASAATFPFHA